MKNIIKMAILLFALQIGSPLNAQVCWLEKDSVSQGADSSAFVVYNYNNGLLTTLEYTDSAGQSIETTDSIIYGSNGKQSHIRSYDAGLVTLFRTTTLTYDANDRLIRVHILEDNGFGPNTVAHDILYNGSNEITDMKLDPSSVVGTTDAFDMSFENMQWQNGNVMSVDLIGDLMGLGTNDTIEFRMEYDSKLNVTRHLPIEEVGILIEQISSNNMEKLITVNDEIFGAAGSLAFDRTFTYYPNDEVSSRTENMALFTDEEYTVGFAFDCSGISLKENEFNTLSIYPLPAKNVLNIESDDLIKGIKLYGLNGQLILNLELEEKNPKLSLNGIKSGLYIMEVIGENKLSRKKISVD